MLGSGATQIPVHYVLEMGKNGNLREYDGDASDVSFSKVPCRFVFINFLLQKHYVGKRLSIGFIYRKSMGTSSVPYSFPGVKER